MLAWNTAHFCPPSSASMRILSSSVLPAPAAPRMALATLSIFDFVASSNADNFSWYASVECCKSFKFSSMVSLNGFPDFQPPVEPIASAIMPASLDATFFAFSTPSRRMSYCSLRSFAFLICSSIVFV